MSILREQLTAAGYAPREVRYEDVFAISPVFGHNEEAVFFVYAGPDRQRMHALAQHLYHEWSLRGGVLYIVYHLGEAQEEDVFKLWALDALWKYNAEHAFIVLNQSLACDLEENVRQIVRVLPRLIGEGREPEAGLPR
ncbi:MAG TPA: hypothetical protein VFB38_20200 [Chthonomonadaceae bacterium]|nr:hypothetical protein [Chthonomonadaceae bacterium]